MSYRKCSRAHIKEFDKLLRESIEKRIKIHLEKGGSADKIGVWISGGIDSSTILYYLRDRDPTGIHISFEGKYLDQIRELAAHLGFSIMVWKMRLSDHFDLLDEALRNTRELKMTPFPTVYLYSVLKSKSFDLVFSGSGLDELTGGYPGHARASDEDFKKVELKYLDRAPRMIFNPRAHARAHGLKIVFPFFDPELVDFCQCLPRDTKTRGAYTKILLREVMENRLTSRVRLNGLMAGTKGGFHPPIWEWWRGGLGEWVNERISFLDKVFTRRNLWRKITRANEIELTRIISETINMEFLFKDQSLLKKGRANKIIGYLRSLLIAL